MSDGPFIQIDDVAQTADAIGVGSPLRSADEALSIRIMASLLRHYPGWQWSVSAQHEQGVVIVRNLNLANKAGFVLHIADLKQHDAMEREGVDAGGEFLERYGMPRGKFDSDRYMDFIKSVGAVHAYISAVPN